MRLKYILPGGRQRLKKDWIALLRSGKYKQCYGKLKNKGAYCALGLTKVLGVERPYSAVPSFLGISYIKITNLNDTRRLTFPEIADYIEKL